MRLSMKCDLQITSRLKTQIQSRGEEGRKEGVEDAAAFQFVNNFLLVA